MKIHITPIGRAAALAAALLLSSGCATKGDLRRLGADLRALSVRQDSMLAVLTQQNAITQDTLRRQGDQLFEVRGDFSRQLQRIQDALATLTELTGQNQRTIASMRDQLEGLRRGGVAAAPTGGEAIAGTDQAVAPGLAAGAAQETYDAALQQYQRGSLATAQRAFEDFLEQYGNHELAPEARFRLADILEQQGHPPEALAAFNQIPELHPTSTRVPDALYRIGLLHLELGNREEAKRFLDRVVNTYPESLAAGPAREKLREMQ
ncbi:MAG: tetratricopeptide repeat protein [Gemmatimonadetes bacterium]|nr:tetratricopeptide repeat protein [Gemmatimonadota bacterium]